MFSQATSRMSSFRRSGPCAATSRTNPPRAMPAAGCRKRLTAILGARRRSSAARCRPGSCWTALASPPTSRRRRPWRRGSSNTSRPAASTSFRVLRSHDGARWTPVPLDEGLPSQTLVLLPGDWNTGPTASWLPRLAETAAMALRLSAARQAARTHAGIAASAYGFARRLSQLSGERELHQFIVDATARAANARLAGLSVYQPKEAAITVAATYGYPSESVGHVRIAPGSGIIGGVFSSKKPLLVRDTTRVPGLTPQKPALPDRLLHGLAGCRRQRGPRGPDARRSRRRQAIHPRRPRRGPPPDRGLGNRPDARTAGQTDRRARACRGSRSAHGHVQSPLSRDAARRRDRAQPENVETGLAPDARHRRLQSRQRQAGAPARRCGPAEGRRNRAPFRSRLGRLRALWRG